MTRGTTGRGSRRRLEVERVCRVCRERRRRVETWDSSLGWAEAAARRAFGAAGGRASLEGASSPSTWAGFFLPRPRPPRRRRFLGGVAPSATSAVSPSGGAGGEVEASPSAAAGRARGARGLGVGFGSAAETSVPSDAGLRARGARGFGVAADPPSEATASAAVPAVCAGFLPRPRPPRRRRFRGAVDIAVPPVASSVGFPSAGPGVAADPVVDPVVAARGARGRGARAGRAEGSSPSPLGRERVLGEAGVSDAGSSDGGAPAGWSSSSEAAGLGPRPLPRPPLPRPPRLRRRGAAGVVPSGSAETSVVDETSSRTGSAATELVSSVMLDAPFAVAGAIGGVGTGLEVRVRARFGASGVARVRSVSCGCEGSGGAVAPTVPSGASSRT